ncbi:MAG: sigma 54-interacting transcriptional regulator [Bacillota bacterium]|nr:sigma 54-interacting transcriptional regulator [Bacillota bacterium]
MDLAKFMANIFKAEDIATLSELGRLVDDDSGRHWDGLQNALDLSDRKMDEAVRSQLVASILGALELSYDGIWITDRHGRTIYANQASRQFYDAAPEEIIGRNVDDLIAKGYFDVCASRDAANKRAVVSRVIRSRTGRELLVTAKPVLSGTGDVAYVISNVRDITRWQTREEDGAGGEGYPNFMRRYGIVFTEDSPLVDVAKAASRVAKTDCTVLLEGESGVGKEVFARFIHQCSARCDGPFEAVNCGAIPETLFESEMFGHQKGAFTGALVARAGAFERAQGGTLFLDEVSEIPLTQQVKLLRAIQEGEVRRLGSKAPVKLNVRIIAATNRNLAAYVKDGRFRDDLYYRLNVVPLYIPPVRERKGDIALLLETILSQFNHKYGCNKLLSPDAIQALLAYAWPGNVREMINLIERLVIISPGNVIRLVDLPEHISRQPGGISREGGIESLKDAMENVEKKMLLLALKRYGSSRKAAKALKVTHSTICRKAKKYGLPLDQ